MSRRKAPQGGNPRRQLRHEPLVRARLGRGNRWDRRGQPWRDRHSGRISVEDVSRIRSRGQASGATPGWTSRGRAREEELTVVFRAGTTGSRGATPEGASGLRPRFGGAGDTLGEASAELEGPLPRSRAVRGTRKAEVGIRGCVGGATRRRVHKGRTVRPRSDWKSPSSFGDGSGHAQRLRPQGAARPKG